MDKTVRDKLMSMSEEKYRNFSKALIPGCENMLGVRIPLIKKYAKELIKENSDWKRLIEKDDIYFEETMLRGMLIGMGTAKDDNIETAKKELKNFIGYIDNWSVNDSFCSGFKILDKHHDEFLPDIEKMVKSKKEYEARAGLILLLGHYIKIDMSGKKIPRRKSVQISDLSKSCIEPHEKNVDSKFEENQKTNDKGKYTDKILELLNRDFSENGYYTQMAAGWLLAEMFVVYPETVRNFLEDKDKLKLDEISYKKAIRKICESKTPSGEVKEYIKKI